MILNPLYRPVTFEATKMAAKRPRRQSDDLSGDDTILPTRRLLFPPGDAPSASGGRRASTQPAGRKRKATASAAEGKKPSTAKRPRTQRSRSARPGPSSRGRSSQQGFSPEETELFTKVISECRAEGVLRPHSWKYKAAWDKIVAAFTREFPGRIWTREAMEAKLMIEKRRSERFLDALAILGPAYTGERSHKIASHYPYEELLWEDSDTRSGIEELMRAEYIEDDYPSSTDLDALFPRAEGFNEDDLSTDDGFSTDSDDR